MRLVMERLITSPTTTLRNDCLNCHASSIFRDNYLPVFDVLVIIFSGDVDDNDIILAAKMKNCNPKSVVIFVRSRCDQDCEAELDSLPEGSSAKIRHEKMREILNNRNFFITYARFIN